MRWRTTRVMLLITVALAAGCIVQPCAEFPPKAEEQTRVIFLVSHGWHAGVVIKQDDIRHSDWPELRPFVYMEHLEIGWGDRDYYTSPDPGPGLAAKALLLPTSSVLHVVGFRGPPESYFPNSEIISLELSVAGFEQMADHISQSFSRDKHGSAVDLGPGNYGDSRFYASEETYHLCKTCNTWTASILQEAGCPFTHTSTVSGLMSQARKFGEVVQEKAP